MQAQEIHPAVTRVPAALDLARGFIASLHTDASIDEQEEIQDLILCAAQHLYEQGRSADWSAFEPVSFLIAMSPPSAEAEAETCFTMIGFIGWAAFHGFVDCGDAALVIEEIERAAPPEAPANEVLVDLARTTAGLLREVEAVTPRGV